MARLASVRAGDPVFDSNHRHNFYCFATDTVRCLAGQLTTRYVRRASIWRIFVLYRSSLALRSWLLGERAMYRFAGDTLWAWLIWRLLWLTTINGRILFGAYGAEYFVIRSAHTLFNAMWVKWPSPYYPPLHRFWEPCRRFSPVFIGLVYLGFPGERFSRVFFLLPFFLFFFFLLSFAFLTHFKSVNILNL